MLTDSFYHSSLRNYVVAFGDVFNNIHVVKEAGDESQTVSVPIHFISKTKLISRIVERSGIGDDVKVRMTVPRMGFDITQISYDATRQLNRNEKVVVATEDAANRRTIFQRVPYNIDFELNIVVKHIEEGLQIVEQILPFFSPAFNITLNDYPGSATNNNDMPLLYTGMSQQLSSEGNIGDEDLITFVMTFTLQAYLYGPTGSQGVIREVIVNWNELGTPEPQKLSRYVLVPDPLTAGPDDEHGYSETITTFDG